jgi:hypothetical protein
LKEFSSNEEIQLIKKNISNRDLQNIKSKIIESKNLITYLENEKKQIEDNYKKSIEDCKTVKELVEITRTRDSIVHKNTTLLREKKELTENFLPILEHISNIIEYFIKENLEDIYSNLFILVLLRIQQ